MKTIKYLLLSVLAFTILVNCGGEEKKTEDSKKVKINAKKETKKKDDNVANVVLTADDFMKFNKTVTRQRISISFKRTAITYGR